MQFLAIGVLLAKKVFYGKMFRDSKNRVLDQFKFDLSWMGIQKDESKTFGKRILNIFFRQKECS